MSIDTKNIKHSSPSFVGEAKEAVLMFRKHKFYLVIGQLLGWFIVIVVTAAMVHVPNELGPVNDIKPIASLVSGVLVLIAFVVMLTQWVVWRLTVGIVTTDHVIDVDQHGLFHHNVSSIPLDQIQDVSVRVTGLIEHILGTGEVRIQSAGEMPNFEFPGVSDPHRVADKILEMHHKSQVEINRGPEAAGMPVSQAQPNRPKTSSKEAPKDQDQT